MEKILHFVRHGQSLSNIGGITMEHHAIPLTDVGIVQAKALSRLLPGDATAVYSSPFLRAQDTAEAFCRRIGQRPKIIDALREFETIDPDLLQGMMGAERWPIADAYWAEGDPHKRMGAAAETFAEFDHRVSLFMDSTLEDLPDGSVLFGHGMWIALLCWKLMGFSAVDGLGMKVFRRFQLGFPMPNGAVYKLRQHRLSTWTFHAHESHMRAMLELADSIRAQNFKSQLA